LRLFPARTLLPFLGFSGMTAPGLVRWVRAHLDDFDVVHIHLGRDLMVLPVAALAHRRNAAYVAQTHGMVIPSRHPLAGPLDALWTRRILTGAAAVFCLNEAELHHIREVAGPDVHTVLLPNGVPEYPVTRQHADPPEVLFLARLHARKRPVLFVEMAHRLLAEGVRARFAMVGPDEGEGPAVLSAIGGESRIRWEGPVDPEQAPQRIAQATLYVLPAEREPYPMAVLEAMSVGVPVVVASDCGLAPVIRDTSSGQVAAGSVEEFAAAVRTVLADADEFGRRASETARRDFAMGQVARRLLAVYEEAIDR
jgi:glycosyltransferase involved in cell wall biosynthesis